ncbi:MAG: hypothetical protein M1835_003973 [Candelina submexicana]|nr:MAG: hypothetical protein M1835_003973 [Candelina submexicana]
MTKKELKNFIQKAKDLRATGTHATREDAMAYRKTTKKLNPMMLGSANVILTIMAGARKKIIHEHFLFKVLIFEEGRATDFYSPVDVVRVLEEAKVTTLQGQDHDLCTEGRGTRRAEKAKDEEKFYLEKNTEYFTYFDMIRQGENTSQCQLQASLLLR